MSRELKFKESFIEGTSTKENMEGYYIARVYKDSFVVTEEISLNLKDLKEKCQPYIEDSEISEIAIVKIEDVGYFKLPKYLENSGKLI